MSPRLPHAQLWIGLDRVHALGGPPIPRPCGAAPIQIPIRPQFDRTLRPARDEITGSPDFEEYLHIGLFVRYRVSDGFEVDTGLRGAIVDLYPCSSSDCWPETFGGAYIQPMVGWRRVKVGARLIAGWVGEQEEGGANPEGSTFAIGLTPLLVRATLPW